MTTQGLIIMTALVPTQGHKYLIDFARNFLSTQSENFQLTVMVCSRDVEPTRGWNRVNAFRQEYPIALHGNEVNFINFHGEVPQNPEDHPDFWNEWARIIWDGTNCEPDYLFVSEPWGVQIAESITTRQKMKCEFIPCNIARDVVPISGTKVRTDPIHNWNEILPYFQWRLAYTVTIFGAESTGKTTVAKALCGEHFLSESLNAQFIPEWAREYLETVGKEITDDKMMNIARAQYASQVAARSSLRHPITIQDTDLLSTIGYYRIYNGKEPDSVRKLFENTKSDLYVVMNSNIPFEPDPLRYGGHIRESTDQFWIDLLKEFDCNYILVEATHPEFQVDFIENEIYTRFMDNPVFTYVRD